MNAKLNLVLYLCNTFSICLMIDTEIVFIISGDQRFGSNPSAWFKKPIYDTISFTMRQFQNESVASGIIWAAGNEKVQVVSPMLDVRKAQEENLKSWLRMDHTSKQYGHGLTGSMKFAELHLFIPSDHVKKIAIVLTNAEFERWEFIDFLGEMCSKIVTYFIAFPWPWQSCEKEEIQRKMDAVNAYMNYTGELIWPWAFCSSDFMNLTDFNEMVFDAIESDAYQTSFCRTYDTDIVHTEPECTGFWCPSNAPLIAAIVIASIVILLCIAATLKLCYKYCFADDEMKEIVLRGYIAEALASHHAFLMAQSNRIVEQMQEEAAYGLSNRDTYSFTRIHSAPVSIHGSVRSVLTLEDMRSLRDEGIEMVVVPKLKKFENSMKVPLKSKRHHRSHNSIMLELPSPTTATDSNRNRASSFSQGEQRVDDLLLARCKERAASATIRRSSETISPIKISIHED